ncbi:PREDICTED: bone morphogenetic protein 4-like [Nanorana parkeri]|uniref:bone morphogenetic protein 4-like n=1 Tax=Nanorana parkeri TaxID=125878 RepID=UPI000854C1DB|nr:PREDICTED: bone morphogenetic protein 4-like [Nanorana parkeri]
MQSSPWKVRCATLCFTLLSITGVKLRPLGEQEKMIQLEAVKKSILDRLGLHRPPVIREKMDKDEMRKIYWLYQEKLMELRGNISMEETPKRRVHILTPKLERSTKKCGIPGNSHRYNLIFSRTQTIHQQLSVMRAELKLCKDVLAALKSAAANSTSKAMVNIYKVTESIHGNGEQEYKLLDSKSIDKDILALNMTLNVDTAVQQWIASSEKCLRLELVIILNIPFVSDGRKQMRADDALVLEVETQEQAHSKTRRARSLSVDEDCKKSEKKCCRKSLLVSFEQIGWSDWIVHPSTYEMRFCDGSCPHNYKPASMHAQIKYRMHHINGETPAPCCVPGSYDPMVLMHYNSERKLVFTVFDDMIVKKCHCA